MVLSSGFWASKSEFKVIKVSIVIFPIPPDSIDWFRCLGGDVEIARAEKVPAADRCQTVVPSHSGGGVRKGDGERAWG